MKHRLVLAVAMVFMFFGFLFGLASLFLAREITITMYNEPPFVWKFADTFFFPPVVWMTICWIIMILLMRWAFRIEYFDGRKR